MPPTVAALYAAGRHALLDLAATFEADQASIAVPVCPLWTVKDVYAHLAGVATDAVAGRLEGAATDPWTERQVAERADRSLTDVCAEWAETGPQLEDALKAFGDAADPRLIADQWTHEQDIRAAVGRPGNRSDDRVRFLVDAIMTSFGGRWKKEALPAVDIVGDSGRWRLGGADGDPELTLTASDYELGRMAIGRRSLAQVLAMDWSPPGHDRVAEVADHLHVFPWAANDLVE